MSSKVTLSVIVPVYNVKDYLSSCIDSILSQSFQDIELILVDDGSTDGSGSMCDLYAKSDSRVHVFHIPNGGVSKARNLGMSYARGKWITFVDSDDLVPKDTFSTCISYAESKGFDIVMTRMSFELNSEGTETFTPQINIGEFHSERSEKFVYEAILNFKLSFLGKIYRASLLEGISFPENIPNYEDFMLLWQVALKYPSYILIDHVGYIARCRLSSASRARNGVITYRKRVKSLICVCEKMVSLFSTMQLVHKSISKFVIVEGLACKDLYMNFDNEDKEEVIALTHDLWNVMNKTCYIPWYMRIFLFARVKELEYKINGFPKWLYFPIRLMLRIM